MTVTSLTAPRAALVLGAIVALFSAEPARGQTAAEAIPLPEHPRPDFQRADWINLNGRWQFKFDAADQGERTGWFKQTLASPHSILVPFSWGAPLSGVTDSADIGWYQRTINVLATSTDAARAAWRVSTLSAAPVGQWEPTHDPVAWHDRQSLYLFVQRVGQGDGETLERIAPQTVSILEWRPATP